MANHQKRSAGRQPADSTLTELPPDTGNGDIDVTEAPAVPAAGAPAGEAPRQTKTSTLNINDLKDMSIQKLTQVAKDLNVAGATGMRKQDLIFQILKA
jgi:transcription termination factor Rho